MNWYKLAEHDYDVSNDYQENNQVEQELIQFVNNVISNIKSQLLPQIQSFIDFSDIKVHFVTNLGSGFLGKYVNGTHSFPVIVIDLENCEEVTSNYNLLYVETTIETTILHELGHAIQECLGISQDEKEAEKFAFEWYKNRKIIRFRKNRI